MPSHESLLFILDLVWTLGGLTAYAIFWRNTYKESDHGRKFNGGFSIILLVHFCINLGYAKNDATFYFLLAMVPLLGIFLIKRLLLDQEKLTDSR
jgi:hypothetical protein